MASETARQIRRYLINPRDVATNLAYWLRAGSSDLPIIFVLGAPRSGTTLIHRVLLNHAAITGFPAETSVFSPKSLTDFSRFGFVDRSVFEQAHAETRDIVGFFAALHRLSFPSAESAGSWYVEKTPQHVKRLRFLLRHFPSARVIHVVRDGRDAFCSGRSAGNIPQARRLSRYARYWMTCTRARVSVASERVLDVSYEAFTAQPDIELKRIMDFLGLAADVAVQLGAAQRARDLRVDAAPFVRLGQDINTHTVGRWRAELTAHEHRQFNRIAGAGLRHFGYPLD